MGKTARGVIAGISLFAIFGLTCAVCLDATRDTAQEEPADPTQEKIDAQFSAWDGSHRILVAAVEKTLHDPGSFEHLETRTMKGANYPETFIVSMQYTATNAFGGRVRNTVVCEVDVETGAIMQVLSD